MSRTARITAAAALSALLCAGVATTAVTDGSTKISASGPSSINWDTAPKAGANSINWD